MNRDYYKLRRARLPLVQALHALGFSGFSIAKMLGFSSKTVCQDLMSVGLEHKEHTDPEIVFANALRRYAELIFASDCSALDMEVRQCLAAWLPIEKSAAAIQSLVRVQHLLTDVEYSSELEGYARLVKAVVGEGIREDFVPPDLWNDYLQSIAACAKPPGSLETLLEELTQQHVRLWREQIRPIWPENAEQVVGQVLCTLTAREEQVVRKRFGIGCKARLLRELGDELGVSPERVRMLEGNALRRLRHSSRRYIFETLGKPFGVAAVSLPEPKLDLRDGYPEVDFNNLLLDTEQLELSTRTYNCLIDNANLKKIWQVCERNEQHLLEGKNFGRKCLKEIKEILAELGLRLGMSFDGITRAKLIEKSRFPPGYQPPHPPRAGTN